LPAWQHVFAGTLAALCIALPPAPALAELPAKASQDPAADAARTYEAHAFALEDQGRPREAEPLLRLAIEVRRKSFGDQDRRTAAGYVSLALNLDTQSRDAEAEVYFRKALAIQRAALGARHPDVGMTLNNLASCLDDQGRHAEAEPLLRSALAIARARSGETGLATAAVYGNLALNRDAVGRRTVAEPLFRKALEINRKILGDRHPAVATATANLASNLVGQGRYADAEPLFRLALDIDRRTFGDGHYRVATDLDRLAADLDEQGRPMEAESLYRRALEIRRSVFGENNPSTAAAYGAVAGNLHAQGRYAEAEPLYRKALEIDRAALGDKVAATAADYQSLAINLDAQRRHPEAEPLLRKALEIRRAALGDRREATGSAFNALAENLDAQERHGEAERMHRRALEIFRDTLGEQHPQTALAYASLASNLNRQKRYDAAEPLLRKALAIRRGTLGEHHPETAEAYDSLAQTLYLRYDHTQAEPLSARAVAIVRERRTSDLREAGSDADTAIRRARADQGLGVHDSRIYARHLRIAWLAARDRPSDLARLREEAFLSAQDLDSSPAAKALAQTVARTASGVGADLARRRQLLSGHARRLEVDLVRSLAGGDAARPAQLRVALDSTGRELAALDNRLRRANPLFADLTSPAALSVSQVQRRLRPGEGLLLIVPTGDDVHVFAVSSTRVAWNRLFDQQAEIDKRVRMLRCQVDEGLCAGAAASPSAADHLPALDLNATYALYRDLLAPVEGALQGVDRLLVTTSGSLADLPLAMLTTAPGDGTSPKGLAGAAWLANRYALTTLPSVLNLRAAGSGLSKPATVGRRLAFLGYGNPVVTGGVNGAARRRGASSGTKSSELSRGLPPLPGAGKELRAMADALGAPSGSVHMGAQATEASVKTSPGLARANVVAFATHGLLSNEVKGIDEPSLVFTPPAKASAADDGLLTASEAAQLKLTADWVILSACNTAGSDGTPGGDAMSGLARAFLYAGAKALLASHWHVFDDATAALTVETLTIQRANPMLAKSQALQKAMAAVRTGHRADGSRIAGWTSEWAHPAYWAPFVLISAGE
jgi:CHAT domain-containing protein/tetratricopeptide (TPR) repeat protein